MIAQRNMASDQALVAEPHAIGDQRFSIVLKPLSHAELGDIRIDEDVFAIGRSEVPFDSYAPPIIADLSHRHARIFSEYGAVYIADMDSKNGTTVNRVDVQQKITRLRDGDEICFGKALSYRVQLCPRAQQRPARTAKLISLTLTPERGELGLQPIVVTQFPFLISKADEAFSRYRDDHPQQVNYLSRRHAHIFLKSDAPFIEDLGSTNGTFIGGNRLDEHAIALKDGDILAFGGHHFVYQVSLQRENAVADPTVTKFSAPAAAAAAASHAGDADKTTFVAAVGVLAFALFYSGAPERELKALLENGEYGRAAVLASRALERDPDNAQLKALGTEASLKANLPQWMAMLKARQFDRAAALLAGMKKLGGHNPDLQALLKELEWAGNLERLVSARGGADAPIRSPDDAAKIKAILRQWDEDTQGHQRAFVMLSAYVPAFKDTYAEALSHLRKLALTGWSGGNE